MLTLFSVWKTGGRGVVVSGKNKTKCGDLLKLWTSALKKKKELLKKELAQNKVGKLERHYSYCRVHCHFEVLQSPLLSCVNHLSTRVGQQLKTRTNELNAR